MRIGGLASGMDIDSIVKDMMKVKRMPLDKMKQQKQIIEWKRDDYRSINTMLLGFRDRLAQLKLTSNYRARMVTSTDEAKVSATVTSGASQASYSISKVEQLATAATRIGGKIEGIDSAISLKDQENLGIEWKKGVIETRTFSGEGSAVNFDAGGKYVADSLSVKVNGTSYEVVASQADLNTGNSEDNKVWYDVGTGELKFNKDLAKGSSIRVDYAVSEKATTHKIEEKQNMIRLGKSSIAELSVSVDGKTYTMETPDVNGFAALTHTDAENNKTVFGKVNVATGDIMFELPNMEGKDLDVTFKQNYTDFTIESYTSKGKVTEHIFVTGNESLNNVIRKVNESTAGVTMFFDEHTSKLTMTRKETGKFNNTGDDINISGAFNTILKFDGAENSGQNAKFTINGLETERTSNTFSMNGVSFTLKQVFTDGTPISVNVSNDSEGVLKTVKDFVGQYNTLIDDINKKLTEERNRKYLPLTDDEREELSDKQQEKWEELAKSGLLKGDPMLSGVLSQMRLDMSSSVETNSLFKQLAAIGITTTANYLDGGKLEINETKLKEAIEQDPEAVENLFRGTGTTDADRGVVHKLYDSVNQSISKIQDRAGRATSTNQQFALGRELISVDKNIDSFETRLKMQEDRLWRQFTAMEKAIQRANNQAVYLMQQFGGGMY
ncbi:flagellar hook protein [Siminovitchia acidinfaciens]|uniref:Flagellar hook-associated protein 2 n=1 Tax=Siminovitchia acidinfaciens TaxID=2321395 RepID=A0A429Y7Z1_9BACI|nr:flagellar filament capping protein FliD [Siminovitchia acidinfaciens]RST77503.1 flagellar hook protein [Siminovitchia acidinfaciens]